MREVIPHYEAGSGIRPPRKSGKYRGVAREIVVGGGMELWHCDHDHAPNIHGDARHASDAQREEAEQCALAWIREGIRDGRLQPMPVTRDGEELFEPRPGDDPGSRVPEQYLATPAGRLQWLGMCIQGMGYLLADPQPGLFTWTEAYDRGWRRIEAARQAVGDAQLWDREG